MRNMLSDQDVRRIAAEAFCDPRTVRKHLAGETVRLSVRERIEKAMKKLHLTSKGKAR